MQTKHTLKNFVFGGILANEALSSIQEKPIEVQSLSKEDTNTGIDLSTFSSSMQSNAINMARIYSLFFCFENSVRELVSKRLKEKYGNKWWIEKVGNTIKSKVGERKSKEKQNKWHSARGNEEINYCDFGDLTTIIISNWIDFEDFFPDQEWIRTRLGDLETSRNVLAHNNILAEADIARIRIYVNDWIRQVG